jgi:hypothetical protein
MKISIINFPLKSNLPPAPLLQFVLIGKKMFDKVTTRVETLGQAHGQSLSCQLPPSITAKWFLIRVEIEQMEERCPNFGTTRPLVDSILISLHPSTTFKLNKNSNRWCEALLRESIWNLTSIWLLNENKVVTK